MSHSVPELKAYFGGESTEPCPAQSASGTRLLDSDKYEHWRLIWNSKQDVIESLLNDLERTMKLSQPVSAKTLRVAHGDSYETTE